jgi:hypothetical protein
MRTNEMERTAGTLCIALAPEGHRRRTRRDCDGRSSPPERVAVTETLEVEWKWRAAWRTAGARRAERRRPFIEGCIVSHVMGRMLRNLVSDRRACRGRVDGNDDNDMRCMLQVALLVAIQMTGNDERK